MIDLLLRFVLPITFVLMAGFLLFLALKALLGKKPLVFSARWMFGFLCVGFFPALSQPFWSQMPIDGGFDLLSWINPMMFAAVLAFFWFQFRGWVALGITEEMFREALLASAAASGYTVEETMSQLRIKETGDEFQVAIQGWIGTAQMRPKGKSSHQRLAGVVEGMGRFFEGPGRKINPVTPYFYLVLAAFLVVIAAVMGLGDMGVRA